MLWALVKQAASSGILQGGMPYSRNFRYVGQNIPVFAGALRYNTVAQAIAASVAGDVIMLGPGVYSEDEITIETADILIYGAGLQGEIAFEPNTGQNAIHVMASGVTFVNIDFADGSGGTYAVKVGDADHQINRTRFFGCKFEGDAIGLLLQEAGDCWIIECEFAWSVNGLRLQSGNDGFCTEIYVRKCNFHDITTDQIGQSAAAQQVDTLEISDCIFNTSEGGTAPSHFINLSDNGNSGIVTNNSFAVATNTVAKIVVGTSILYVANRTVAGISTARPA